MAGEMSKKYERYMKLVKDGKSKAEALSLLKKEFGSGLGQETVATLHARLRVSDKEMRKRGQMYFRAKKTVVSAEPAKLKPAPRLHETKVSTALPVELAEYIKKRMKWAKEMKATFLLDVDATLANDWEERVKIAELMKAMGLDKLQVTEHGFSAERLPGKISGSL